MTSLEARLREGFPIREGQAELSLVEVVCEDATGITGFTAGLTLPDEGLCTERQIVTSLWNEREVVELLARARRRLAEAVDPDSGVEPWMMADTDFFTEHQAFRKLGPPVARPEGTPLAHELSCQDVWLAVHRKALDLGAAARHRCLGAWPAAVRHVYFLWEAVAQIGGQLIDGYMVRCDLEDLYGILDAVSELGCAEFERGLRQGFGLAIQEGPLEFLEHAPPRALADLRSRALPPPPGGWDANHAATRDLIERDLRPALVRQVDRHRDELAARPCPAGAHPLVAEAFHWAAPADRPTALPEAPASSAEAQVRLMLALAPRFRARVPSRERARFDRFLAAAELELQGKPSDVWFIDLVRKAGDSQVLGLAQDAARAAGHLSRRDRILGETSMDERGRAAFDRQVGEEVSIETRSFVKRFVGLLAREGGAEVRGFLVELPRAIERAS